MHDWTEKLQKIIITKKKEKKKKRGEYKKGGMERAGGHLFEEKKAKESRMPGCN